MDEDDKNEGKPKPVQRTNEETKGENHNKLMLGENQLFDPNRRSYNEHLGSINFINLLDGDRENGGEQLTLKANIRSLHLVSNVSDSDKEEMHSNEKQGFCLPSSNLINKASKPFGFKSSSPRSQVQAVDIFSQGEFASQTLNPSTALEERQLQNRNTKYKLKEFTPGCLPGKGKSKKLQQRKGSGRMEGEGNEDRGDYNEERLDGVPYENSSCADSAKVTRRKSFLSALKFIKLRKFGKKKKQKQESCEATEISNWEADSTESSEEQKHDNPYKDDELVFGGVRVFIDENGECYEVDEDFDLVSNQSTASEGDSQSSTTAYGRAKFESRDSLNLGYSGCFIASEIVDI